MKRGLTPMAVVGGLFFLSGFAALGYQVVWQRLLTLFAGSDARSVTTIVAVFLAGLGCGNIAAGRLADRLSRAGCLAAFAATQLAIAVFGLFSAPLYYDLLYRQFGHISFSAEATAVILFVSLLWPTMFMGASLPLLVRALTTQTEETGTVAGVLYGLNTLGAAAGALGTTWVLLPWLGLDGSLRACAALNVIAAFAVLPTALQARLVEPAAPVPAETSESAPFAMWLMLSAAAGLMAVSWEIVWIRVLTVMLKSATVAFGTAVAAYLTGIGVGAVAGALLVRRTRRPGRAFLLLQSGAALYAGLAVLAVVGPAELTWLGPRAVDEASDLWRSGATGPTHFALLCASTVAFVMGPPAVLIGAGFPMLQRTVHLEFARVGRRTGALLLANSFGSAAAAVITGWVLLERFGTADTARLLVVASLAFATAAWLISRDKAPRSRRLTAAATIAASVLVVTGMPDARALWAPFHGATVKAIEVGEDASGLYVLRSEPAGAGHKVGVFVGGASHSWLPYGEVHTVLGALPAFLHPAPRFAAVIGLGSGDSLFAMAGRREIERIACAETVRPQLEMLKRLHEAWAYPGLGMMLADPRIQHVPGDGRLALLRGSQRYDLIEVDALAPRHASAGNLVSDGFFSLMRDRLREGGLATSWTPTRRIHDTFVAVFPHVVSFGGIAIGSRDAIPFDAAAIRRRLDEPHVRAYYAAAGVDIVELLARYLEHPPLVLGPGHDRSGLTDINTDLFPKDEFSVYHEFLSDQRQEHHAGPPPVVKK